MHSGGPGTDVRSGSAAREPGRTGQGSVDVCVVIVNWNTREALDDCLTSLEESRGEIEARIVVVDNGSRDGSVRMLRDRHDAARVVENAENRGFAAAVNQGLEMALAPPMSARTVLLLNSDTRVPPGSLERSVHAMLRAQRVGALGCRLLDEDGSFQVSCHRFVTLPRLLLGQVSWLRPLTLRLGLTLDCSPGQHESGDFDYLKGAFLLLRAEAVRDVGPLDERFFMYAEEADLCLRLRRAGWRLEYLSDVSVVHVGGGSTGGDRRAPKASVNRLVSRLKFIEKHRRNPAFGAAVVLHLLVLAARWTAASLLGRERERTLAGRKLRACLERTYEIPEAE